MVRHYAWIGFFGALGACCRWGLGVMLLPMAASTYFPWGTWSANLVGCFLIGYVSGGTGLWRVRLTTGFVGAFTTFSTFSVEAIELIHAGRTGLWLTYSISSVVGGWLMLIIGQSLRGRFVDDLGGGRS